MGATHFLTKTLPKVTAEMALSVLAYTGVISSSVMGWNNRTANQLDRMWFLARLTANGPKDATTMAGTKPTGCRDILRLGRNDRRHRSSNEREMPYRRAVAATWRGACKLSTTILSFSSSDQRPMTTNPPARPSAMPQDESVFRSVPSSSPHTRIWVSAVMVEYS
jgi:hypothetical protein